MEKTRDELKNKFKKGDKPTENDYANFIDSYVHKSEDPYFKFNELPEASKLKPGIVEQATIAEVESGADINKFVSPLGAERAVLKFAPKPPVLSVNGDTGNVTIPVYTPEDSGWQTSPTTNLTIQNSNAIGYRKIVGIIHLTGEFTISSATSGNTNLFTLKNGYRPDRNSVFHVIGSDNSMVRIQINTSGQVVTTNNSNTTISISGLSFVTKQ